MDKTASILSRGGVALLPTDTVYGLAALPSQAMAVQKIFALKGRPANKNLPILAASLDQIEKLGLVTTPRIQALFRSRFIPGALTMVLPVNSQSAPAWLAGRSEAAIRFPKGASLQALLLKTGPLLATSANASGVDTPADVPAILAQLSGAPDIVVDDGPRSGKPSTLINCQTNPFKVIRRGALTNAEIEEIMAL